MSTEYPVLEYGGTVILPQDRPYRMLCCGDGCNLVHDLHASITDDGEIALQVFRNDQETQRLRRQDDNRRLFADAQPEKVPTMTRRQQRRAQRAADRANHQIAEDGEVIRVSMTMMDAALRDDLQKRYGTPSTDDVAKISEARVATQQALARDGAFTADALAMYRPGYRFADAGTAVAGAVADADRSASEVAYAEMCAELQDAWRQKDAAPVQNLPSGRYPLSAEEGGACTIDGRAGTLVREGDYLVCRAKPAGPARSSGDAQSRFMTADEAQPARDAAYREYCERISNEWRAK